MKLLDMFDTCQKSGGYQKTWCGADWKIVDGIMYFQPSHGKTDWAFNFLSALRIPGRLGGTWFIFPLGAWFMFRSLKKIIKRNPVKAYCGYSQGGWFASYASAMTGRVACTFGCPRLGVGSPSLFVDVTHHKTPTDIVTTVPPWAKNYGQTMILQGTFIPRDGMTLSEYAEMLTGHTRDEYRQRMGE